jgi:hypothetical protein
MENKPEFLNTLVGLTEEDAVLKIKEAGLRSRVRTRDDKSFMVTMDYREDRINLYIQNNHIIKATIG